ncbi:MAG: hypothetical protein ACLVJO_01215 [[Clostridium] scindens]
MEMRGGVSDLSLIMIIVIFGGMISYKYKIIKEEKEVLLLRENDAEKFQDIVTSQQNLHDMKNHLVVLRM